MGKSQPDPPSPRETAAAQTGTNVSTAVANAFLNNVNQQTPWGSLNYNPTGSYSWTDPSTNTSYNIPTFTATQSLTPAGERLQRATMDTQQNLANTARTASGRLNSLLGSQVNLSKAPRAGTVPTLQTSYAGAGDFSADRKRYEDALWARGAGDRASADADLRTTLANKGLTEGSAAWNAEMERMGRQNTDARLATFMAGGEEQSRMVGLAQQAAAFNNTAAAQQYGLQQDARNQYLNQAYGQRNQSLNEILGLMSGSQVQNPNFVNTAQNTIQGTNYAGIVQQDYENRLAQSQNNGLGGLFGLGGSVLGAAGNAGGFGSLFSW